MSRGSALYRVRWQLGVAAATVVTAIFNPTLSVAVVLAGLTFALYLLWSRTRDRRSGWPRAASVGFSAVILGLAALFGVTTAYGALASVGVIERAEPSAAAAPSANPADQLAARETASPAPTPTQPTTASPTATPTPTPTPVLGAGPTGATVTATVVRVVDGDTVRVLIDGQEFPVRYIGIDTPETVDPRTEVQWMGPEASAANAELLAGGTVILEKDVSEVDQFDRLLRYVWVERSGTFLLVNRELVRLGYALPSSYPPDVKYNDLFTAAAREARDSNAGLWGESPTPSPTPQLTATPTPTPPPSPVPTAAPTPPPAPPADCHPSYLDACLLPTAPDYDCLGGSGNGPYYTGRVRVVGPDVFGLDGDGDLIGCE